jgi:hypothetical protein
MPQEHVREKEHHNQQEHNRAYDFSRAPATAQQLIQRFSYIVFYCHE